MAAAKEATNGTKAPKKGPDYTLKPVTALVDGAEGGLEKILAPEAPRTHSVARAELKDNLLKLQANPGTPFEVAHYAARPGTEANPSGARKIVAQILLPVTDKKRITLPQSTNPDVKGYYDVEWRTADYDGSDREGSVVIAMWVTE